MLCVRGHGCPGDHSPAWRAGRSRVSVLQQCLELVVLGESNDLKNGAELGEDLWERVVGQPSPGTSPLPTAASVPSPGAARPGSLGRRGSPR